MYLFVGLLLPDFPPPPPAKWTGPGSISRKGRPLLVGVVKVVVVLRPPPRVALVRSLVVLVVLRRLALLLARPAEAVGRGAEGECMSVCVCVWV